MSFRWRIIGLGCAAAISLAPAAASADSQATLGAPVNAVGLVDPWADHGGSIGTGTRTSWVHEDTLDPWRAAAWTRVRSGLDALRAPAAERPSRAALPLVRSGLDVTALGESDAAQSWVHPEIVDPWAGRSLRP